VIACGVLAIDIQHVAERLGLEVTTDFLEGGLHDRPGELRRRLQEAIDRASSDGRCDRIAVGYGICGRGTVGIRARGVPLALPKAQDCIALFLGSDAAYRREFARFPGTYYTSAGWYEEKVQPRSQKTRAPRREERSRNIEHLAEKYGEENARAIEHFLSSWQRNYQRAAFIDTGAPGRERYAEHAQAMAEEFGWDYEALPGDLALLEKLLTAERSDREVLIVPPNHATVHDPIEGALAAAPVREDEQAAPRAAERDSEAQGTAADADERHAPVRFGLGIDAGGTYTDAVVYDFSDRRVVAKNKALTTPWDFTEGIEQALEPFDDALLERVGLVALSTTLATNAIVEGDGQRVGLALMPPYGLFRAEDVPHEPKAVLSARLEIDGREQAPVDEAEVRRVARQMVERGVAAFAVSGYAGAVNPSHELRVKELLREETGLGVTCGHELSELLNFRTRADTAVLNARIIPKLERLIEHAERCLVERGASAPLMVVKGDGSLMSAELARARPVETILSGPAASVAGAKFLTGEADALVVDMGGTTTDTAAVTGGSVRTCADGARVGGWKTHVQALDMRTCGLGGDSRIGWEKGELHVGPARVAPAAWMAASHPRAAAALDYLAAHLDDYAESTEPMDLLAPTGYAAPFELRDEERRVLTALGDGPCSLAELAERIGAAHPTLLATGRLEEHHLVQRCGLTPTDLLHAQGDFERWDAEAARRLRDLVGRLLGMTGEALAERVVEQMVRRMAVELLKKELDETTDADTMDDCPACQALLRNWLAGGTQDWAVSVALRRPIVGLGAPVHCFLPQAARLLGTEPVIPPDADVANAVGAITSSVVVARQVRIRPNELGEFAVHGLPEARTFERFADASRHAVEELERHVRGLAAEAGTHERQVHTTDEDRTATTADGSTVFLERIITARVVGPPDAAVAPRAAGR
jgi:N-methylhydantoinase A/oxoprolinase/acetone carboxylase beta subunit